MTKLRIFTFIINIFIVGMVELIIAGLLTLMSEDLHVSESVIGQLITIYAFSFAIAGPILVKLTTRFNVKRTLIVSLLIFMFGNLLIVLAPNYTVIVIGRMISSAIAALIVVKILSTTVVLSNPTERAKMLGIVYIGFSGANVFGVPIGTMLGDWFGWRMTFLLIVLLTVVALVLLIWQMPSNVKLENSEGKKRVLSYVEITKFILITTLILAANYVVFTYIGPLMIRSGYELWHVSIVLFIAGFGSLFGTSIGGAITDHIGSKNQLVIMLTIFILMMFVINSVMPMFYLLLIVMFVWSFTQWSTSPSIQNGIVELVEGDTSDALSWNMSGLNVGIGLGALIGGVVVEYGTITMTPWIGGIILIIALAVSLSLKTVSNHS